MWIKLIENLQNISILDTLTPQVKACWGIKLAPIKREKEKWKIKILHRRSTRQHPEPDTGIGYETSS